MDYVFSVNKKRKFTKTIKLTLISRMLFCSASVICIVITVEASQSSLPQDLLDVESPGMGHESSGRGGDTALLLMSTSAFVRPEDVDGTSTSSSFPF